MRSSLRLGEIHFLTISRVRRHVEFNRRLVANTRWCSGLYVRHARQGVKRHTCIQRIQGLTDRPDTVTRGERGLSRLRSRRICFQCRFSFSGGICFTSRMNVKIVHKRALRRTRRTRYRWCLLYGSRRVG